MLMVLSPAKRVTPASTGAAVTWPEFSARAADLVQRMKALSPGALEGVLKVNSALAMGAFMDYQDFDPLAPGTPAILAYRGLAFRYLDGATLSRRDLAFAQEHLRIVSGLYGLLRPMDGIQPHRLEMGCRLPDMKGTLYDFWGDRLCRSLYRRGETVVNLASQEYTRAFVPYLSKGNRLVTCQFYVLSRGRYKVLATAAKMARGAMARYAIENRLEDARALKDFSALDFCFSPAMSTENIYRFYQKKEDAS